MSANLDAKDPAAIAKKPSARFLRLRGWYRGAALLVWNTLLLYLFLNVILGLAFAVKDARRTNPVTMTYGNRLNTVYPDLPEPARTQMLSESWNRPYRYADFIHFQERPFTGKYVNVSEHGYRHSVDQGPWPPDAKHFNVFCFGGSTMFGYGLPDDQTFASCLQSELSRGSSRRVCVYNFSVGWHFSTQERLRFEQLLAQNIVPDLALFLDGINDTSLAWSNRPAFSTELAASFEQVQAFGVQSPSRGTSGSSNSRGSLADALFFRWPVGRAARSLAARIGPVAVSAPVESPLVKIDADRAVRGCSVYRWNRTLIQSTADANNVTAVFVVQPAPGYALDPKKHLFANAVLCQNEATFYAALKQDLEQHPPGKNLIWSADLSTTAEGPLYVDTCHYTAAFSRVIAQYMVAECRKRGLVKISED
jgi:hypothetical protein